MLKRNRVVFDAEPELSRRFYLRCEAQGVTMSEMMRAFIAEYAAYGEPGFVLVPSDVAKFLIEVAQAAGIHPSEGPEGEHVADLESAEGDDHPPSLAARALWGAFRPGRQAAGV